MGCQNQLAEIIKAIRTKSKNGLILVAVDGHSAAGKSTVAQKVAAELIEAEVITTDDFYRPMADDLRFGLDAQEGSDKYYDWQRLEKEVLTLLSQGKPARFQRYDWENNVLGRQKVVEPHKYIIVEGCYAARRELAPYYDVIVFVDTSAAERSRRQQERADASPAWLARWDAAERHYIESTGLRDLADFVFRGEM